MKDCPFQKDIDYWSQRFKEAKDSVERRYCLKCLREYQYRSDVVMLIGWGREELIKPYDEHVADLKEI
jgi:hypothetical protein